MGRERYDYELLEQVAKRLRTLRKSKGLSQERVYFDTGLNIGRIELAKKNLSLTTLSILCAYYGLTLEAFFRGINSGPSVEKPSE